MGLRCLIGHDFGDSLTERDREERGDEVVVTITEYKECTRCGHRQVISENTEVRSAEPEPTPEPEVDTAIDSPDTDEFEDVSAEEDDGIILDDAEEGTPERARGEWPETEESEEEPTGEPAEWPEVESEDEGFDAEPGDGGPADVEFRGGSLEPEAADPSPEDADDIIEAEAEPVEPVGGDAPEPARPGGEAEVEDITSAAPGPTPTQRQRPDALDTEFVCPECGYTADTEASSLRPGDICPECRRGYLNEREA